MNDPLLPLRHSAAHLLAAAIKELYPNTKLGIGPVIENGFYYDFDFEKPLSEDNFEEIEKRMRQIRGKNLAYAKSEKNIDEALSFIKDQKEPFKLEIAEELKNKGEKKVSFYSTGDFIDLCEGPHIENTKDIKVFKLTSLAGAYWRGSEKNKMLTRIYGTAWENQKDLDRYLLQIEEAKKNDHRILGRELGLFTSSELIGKGLPLLTAKGATIRRQLERFVVDEEIKRSYEHVVTPPLANVELYKISGHYPYYKDTMYPVMKVDDEELILRPMTCPHHFMLYKSALHSYKELPVRFAEISPQFRYEKSGELTGLTRVRVFTLADAHIFVKTEDAKTEIKNVLELIDYINGILGLEKGIDYRYRLSLGERTDESKYYKDDSAWDIAEKTLREVLQETKSPFFEASAEAAFYGPKIDIQMKNALGKEETAFTVQYDFVMPKRFELEYIDEKGEKKQPIVIHRSSIGALERIMGLLIERYKGNFPTWLAPIQVTLVPIAERNNEFAQEIQTKLISEGLRSEINLKNEPMQAKIRDSELQKIPYIFVIGDKEQAQRSVAVRSRSDKKQQFLPIENAIELLQADIKSKKYERS